MRVRARSRILDYVARHPGAHAQQIAQGLGMNPPGVRHHLAILTADGRLEAATAPAGPRRGRPRLSFRISDALAGNNLAMLADHFLDTAKTGATGQQGHSSVVRGLAQTLSEHLQPPQAAPSAGGKLAALVDGLNDLHYRSHWEAGADGPRLILGRCPYAAVIQRHPELCLMDSEAVAMIMHADVQQKTKIGPGGAGASSCVFSIKPR